MKRNKWMKTTAWILVFFLMLGLMSTSIQAEAKSRKTKLNNNKITLTVGKSKKIKLSNNSKKVKWTTSNKKVVKITKKSRKYVKVKALKAGTAKITAKVGTKKYVCKVTVKAKKGFFSKTEEATTESPKKPTTEAVTEAPKNPTTERLTTEDKKETTEKLTTEDKTETTEKSTTEENTGTSEKPTTEEKTEKPEEGGITEKPTDPPVGTEDPEQRYTRLEWVKLLLDSIEVKTITEDGVPKDPNGNALYSYVDLKEEASNLTVETAVQQGILVPSEGQEEDVYFFRPEEMATREFASVTAARALGYLESEKALECTDQESLEYPLWDAAAVNIGLIGLKEGSFNGKEELTGAEANQMLVKIKEIKAEENAVPEKIVDIQYADNLVKDSVAGLTDYLVVENEIGYQITINNYTGTMEETGIEAGKPIYLPADKYGQYSEGFVCRVADAGMADGQINISGTPVESVFEVMDSFHLSGAAVIDEIILAEGVTVKNAENEEAMDSRLSAEPEDASDGLTEEEMDSKLLNVSGDSELPLEISLEKSLGKYGSVSLDLEKPTISYDIKCSIKEIERLKFVMSDYGKVSLNIKGDVGTNPPDLEVDVCTLPIDLGAGFYIDVLFSIQAKASASGSLEFHLTSKVGVDLQAEKKTIHQLNLVESGGCTELSLTAGPEVDIALDWLKNENLRIIDLNIGYGAKVSSALSSEADAEGNPLYCKTRTFGDYFSIGSGNVKDSLFSKLGLSIEFTAEHCWNFWHKEAASEYGPFVLKEKCTAARNLYGTVLDKRGEEVEFDNIIVRSKENPENEFRADNHTRGSYTCKVPEGKYEIIAIWDGVIKVRKFVEVDGNTCYNIREGGIIDSGTGTGYSWTITEDGNFECEVDETADMVEVKGIIHNYAGSMKSAYIYGIVGEKQSMYEFFRDCRNLTSVNLKELDTQNVTSMTRMFYACFALEEIDLSNLNTGNVGDMSGMFQACSNLEELDLSSFDTSKVGNMYGMFYSCNSLTKIDLSSFNTSSVDGMNHMFDGCRSLTELDLSNFDTSNVQNMWSMFADCSSLTKLNLSSFDTKGVSHMDVMFKNCSALIELDLSNFDTGIVENMDDMFSGCSSLTRLDVSNFDTKNVKYMRNMFSDCSNLTGLDVSHFDISNIVYMGNMFDGCKAEIIPDWYVE